MNKPKDTHNWDFENDWPVIQGWYVYAYCYDTEEGVLSDVDYFDGVNWCHDGPFSGPFESEKEADDWCNQHIL